MLYLFIPRLLLFVEQMTKINNLVLKSIKAHFRLKKLDNN